VAVVGLMTSSGAEATASKECELGCDATLCINAMTDRDVWDHDFVVQRILSEDWRVRDGGDGPDLLRARQA
jgi:hypothetical protein